MDVLDLRHLFRSEPFGPTELARVRPRHGLGRKGDPWLHRPATHEQVLEEIRAFYRTMLETSPRSKETVMRSWERWKALLRASGCPWRAVTEHGDAPQGSATGKHVLISLPYAAEVWAREQLAGRGAER